VGHGTRRKNMRDKDVDDLYHAYLYYIHYEISTELSRAFSIVIAYVTFN
jgi:hypothetical protein